jgi:hypothetical protein
MSSLYRESLLGLCGYDGSPERLSESLSYASDKADWKAAELLAAEIGQPIDRQVTVYYDLFRTVHW